jgi:hypothetical protein
MIKTAQDAYLAGRQAAMVKLSQSDARINLGTEKLREGAGVLGEMAYAPIAGLRAAAGSVRDGLNEAMANDAEAAAAAAAAGPAHYAGTQGILNALRSAGATANEIRQGIGLGGRGLSRNMQVTDTTTNANRLSDEEQYGDHYSALNPMNYATMENLSRAGMLAGAAGGTYLGGMDPRAAALASAGALGGGFAGGGLGMALGKGIDAYIGEDRGGLSRAAKQQLIAGGGALGGLGGGLAAGQYL